jgi:biotin synthase
MKETKQDVINMARSLRILDADSIPINFLHAIDGTPLEGTNELDPRYCLKVLALFRYMNPTKEIRIAGGREVNLRSLQPLGLYAANSIFVGDYLTTAGQEKSEDYRMLEDLGFEIDFAEEQQAVC